MTTQDEAISLEKFLPYRLARLAAEISRQLRTVYRADHGLTIPEWRTLATLGQFGAVTAKAIGAHASMHKTKVSRAVSALESRRWLTRNRNPDDRREDFLALTRAGKQAYRRLVPKMRAFDDKIIADFRDNAESDKGVDLFATLDTLERVLGIVNQSPGSHIKE